MKTCGRCERQKIVAINLDDSIDACGHTFTAQLPAEKCQVCGQIVIQGADLKLFERRVAVELAKEQRLVILCGHYEGFDARVHEHLATDEISVGDSASCSRLVPSMRVAAIAMWPVPRTTLVSVLNVHAAIAPA